MTGPTTALAERTPRGHRLEEHPPGPPCPSPSAPDSCSPSPPWSPSRAPPRPPHRPRRTARADLVDVPARALVQRVLDPDDYECGPTLFDVYIDDLINAMTDEQFVFLLDHIDTMLDVPTYAPLFFGTDTDPTYALDVPRASSSRRPSAT